MMKKPTIDGSVIITFLLENEPRHEEALRIWEPIIAGRKQKFGLLCGSI
jgi:predicted nucleic acid-binding protein